MFKNAAKAVVVWISWRFAKGYIRRFQPVIIGVAGSIGKTGTKRAIAHVVTSSKRVRWQDGNYNDIVTVPLIFFGLSEPSLFNPFAWLVAFGKMARQLRASSGAQVVVLELGTDAPGQIPAFGRYLRLDYAVVTAIEAEHLENFQTIEGVAKEELSVIQFSKRTFVDQSIVDAGFVETNQNVVAYGSSSKAQNYFIAEKNRLRIVTPKHEYQVTPKLVGQHQYFALTVATAIAEELGASKDDITGALNSLQPMPGRMQPLAGKDGSQLIDDTYNASPVAMQAALDFLYAQSARRRIAVLGNMNEMGAASAELHTQVGKYCQANKLDLVITIGDDANQFLAAAAKQKGCSVQTFQSPYDVGEFLAKQELKDTIILFKGSQNGVFLEEAIKPLLQNPADANRLVRQSASWLAIKQKQFRKTA